MPPSTTVRPNVGHSSPLLHSYEIQLMLRDLTEYQGQSLHKILDGTGVSALELEDPAHRLTLEQELTLYTRIAHCNTNPLLALRTGTRLGLSNYGILGYAMMGASSVREALQLMVEFAPLVSWDSHSVLRQELYREEPCLCLTVLPTPADKVTNAMEVESTFASLQVVFNDLVGEPVQFASIEMAHACAGSDISAYEQLFNCPLQFATGRNSVLFSRRLLAQRLPHAQPEYAELLKDLCRDNMLLLKEDRGLLAAVKGFIDGWETGVPTLAEAADHFSQSARTLRRQLRALGVSYQELIDAARYREARRYLASTHLTVETIGKSLGYADVRSFRCAFKRWSGLAPAQYRTQQQS